MALHLQFSSEGAVGVIELARPEKYNAVSPEMAQGLLAAIDAFEADRGIRAILIRAQGRNFCTGADLVVMDSHESRAEGSRNASLFGIDLLGRFETSPLPIVAAIQGLCLAAGLEIMMACDIVFAAETARIGDQHARYGLFPGWGGTQRLPRLVGLRRGLDLLFTAKWLDTLTAREWGLVNYVTPDDRLWDEAMTYCTMFAKRNPEAIAGMKRLARSGLEGSLRDGLMAETDFIAEHVETANVREGLRAFAERREPRFR